MSFTTPQTLKTLKQQGQKFSCVTSYDATFSALVNDANIDVILVGDSLGMVLQGQSSTLPVSMEEMIYHTACVARGNQSALLMADMPFMSNNTLEDTLHNAGQLMQAGAHIVKLEGEEWLCDAIVELGRRGIPVCAHLGLTPQSVNKLGGYKVQGKVDEDAERIVNAAIELEAAGADMLLLECVPTALARRVTKSVNVPVVGIGAGNVTDGQVLVMHDLLGITKGHKPKFVKNFMAESSSILAAFETYDRQVKDGSFPAPEHSFGE